MVQDLRFFFSLFVWPGDFKWDFKREFKWDSSTRSAQTSGRARDEPRVRNPLVR
jgi:hypothetical protein